jgi:DNA (cytosine-5)-methyltransferase 1
VLEAERPFLLHLTHGDRHAPHSIDAPVPTVTGANRGEQALAVPFMIHRGNGERPGQEPRTYDVRVPHPTVVAGGIKTNPTVAFLAKAYSERPTGGWNGGARLDKPIDTITAQDHTISSPRTR